MNISPRRIAVWNTAFLGDSVLTLPLIATLKKVWPEAELHFYVRKGVEELFQAQPEISQVHAFDKNGRERSLSATVRYASSRIAPRRFDLWISAHPSPRSAVVAISSRAGIRIGYNKPFLNHLFYTHRVSRRFDQLHEIDRLLELLNPLQIDPQLRESWPNLVLSPAARARAATIWAENDLGGRGRAVVAVHPGSVWPTKRWPEEYFSALLRQLAGDGLDFLLLGAPEERAMARRIRQNCLLTPPAEEPENGALFALPGGSRLLDLSGRLSLSELAAVIGRAALYIGNDSGPLHLAWIQHVPVLALFGPTVRRLGFFPRGENSLVLEKDLPCRPCGLHGSMSCRLGHHDCMRLIQPPEAAQAARRQLAAGGRHG